RDPSAMLPFIGYPAGDYLGHWLAIGKLAPDEAKLPKVFQVNWFRRGDDGRFLWPGYGENSRVLKWIIERLEGTADAVDAPIGYVPHPDTIDTTGLDIPAGDIAAALRVDVTEWQAELPHIREWVDKVGDKLPTQLWTELDTLSHRLNP